MSLIIPSIIEFTEANPANKFSSIDYVSYILDISKNKSDTIKCIFEIFFPIFREVDGLYFNISFGTYEAFEKNLENGLSRDEAYYWANVIDISGVLHISDAYSRILSEKICKCWNESLASYNIDQISFRLVEDELDGVLIALPEYPYLTG